MDPKEKAALEAAGHKFTTVKEFLGLSEAESQLIELRLAATRAIRRLREEAGVSQPELARLIGSSQPRVAKIEQGAGVSLDLVLKTYVTLGGSLDKLLAPSPAARARAARAAAAESPRAVPAPRPRRKPAGRRTA